MGNIKPWEDLTIQDDYMFKLVMRRKHICKTMIEPLCPVIDFLAAAYRDEREDTRMDNVIHYFLRIVQQTRKTNSLTCFRVALAESACLS